MDGQIQHITRDVGIAVKEKLLGTKPPSLRGLERYAG
jgi:hypothetical protein